MILPSPLNVPALSASPLGALSQNDGARPGGADPNALTPSFGQTLQNALDSVDSLQTQAAEKAEAFARGRTSDIHGVMIAAEQATISLQLATQVRNKVIDAYQEIMRTTM